MFSPSDNGQPIPLFKVNFVLQVNACWSRNFTLRYISKVYEENNPVWIYFVPQR